MEQESYLRVGRAGDIADKKERTIYRLLEILPGFLSWTTLALIFLLSWLLPFWVAIFIIAFDIYWFLKTIYLSLHMRSAFKKMRHNLTINWLEALERMKWQENYHFVFLPIY